MFDKQYFTKTRSVTRRFLKLTLLLGFLALNVALTAQTMITGVVNDSVANLPLISATVSLEGTNTGVITDLNGEYRIPLAPGEYVVVASYLGYESQQKTIVLVEGGEPLKLDFNLSPQVILGQEVIVTASYRGQRAAINSQLNADGIVNVVSEEQIQELPDVNAGEALSRLPGISLKRSGGEAQKIVLRGLNENFSMIQLDGVPIPPTDAGARGVDLSLFSINSLAGIEVSKAITSNMDADAVAGVVNLVTKKASSEPELRVDLATGYNKLENSAAQYIFGLRYNRRLFKELLGIQIAANTENRVRSSETFSQGWDVRPDSSFFISGLTPSYTQETRKRTGGSLLLDVRLPKGGTIRFNNFYNRTDRDAIRYQRSYPASGNVSYSINDSEREINTINNSLGGEHFLGKLKVNWGASHALSLGKQPYSHELNFDEGGAQGAGMMNIPVQDLRGPGELLIPYAYNNFRAAFLNTAFFQTSENRDRDLIGYLDLERSFTVNDKFNIELQAGGKYRLKDRTNDVDRFRGPYWVNRPKEFQKLPDGSIVPADFTGTSFDELIMVGGTNISMLNFLSDDPPSRNIAGKYNLFPLINPDLGREWYETHKNGISQDGQLDEYNPYQTVLSQIYSMTERISAGYTMATLNLGKMFRVIAGVRFEREDNDYTAKFAPDISGFFTFSADEVGDTTASYSASYILPNFHLRFKPTNWWDLRLAATKTLSRPNFSLRLPTIVVNRTSGSTIDRGRPDLKTAEAWNYDVISSFYVSKYGLFTVGGFFKAIDNVSYRLNGIRVLNAAAEEAYNLPKGHGSYVGLSLNEPINTSGTEVYGLEVDLQTNLKFLPGFLGNFVLRGNFSWIKSTTNIPRFRVDQDVSVFPPVQTPVFFESEERLEGQPSTFGNIALGYDQGGFSSRLSVFFQGDYLTSVSSTGLEDIFQKGYSKWDLALKQEIPKTKMEINMNISNLTNFGEGTFWGYRGLDNGSTFFDTIVDLGLRILL